jgi:hypothetical protein
MIYSIAAELFSGVCIPKFILPCFVLLFVATAHAWSTDEPIVKRSWIVRIADRPYGLVEIENWQNTAICYGARKCYYTARPFYLVATAVIVAAIVATLLPCAFVVYVLRRCRHGNSR